MTAQILAAELANLVQDSKRKNNELRTAAEKSLQDLKSLPNTSEAQLAADLARRPYFISPFLIACGTQNAKFATTGVSCLQRLGVSRALPKDRLSEVLEALRDSSASSHEAQLKVLQALPSLLQNYPAEVRGDLLSTILHICSGLQNAKNPAVSGTAAATLQQLVITVFDRVASEDERALEIPIVTEVKGNDGLIPVRPAANDAYKLFNDLVLLVVGEKPVYMRISAISPPSILELIEAIMSNHGTIMADHVEQVHLVRTLLMPLIIRSLSERLSFPITVRIVRILNLVIRHHLDTLSAECEIALGLMNHMLDPEASQLWKRALCLEFFRSIYADPRLLLSIYSLFDASEGKKAIFGDNLASFVRLAVEKPTLIGLGQQSTIPMQTGDGKGVNSEQAVAEAGAIAGVIGGPVSDSNNNNNSRPFGISSQWSSLKTPCIEHLDKSEPPSLPDTYIYSLVLICVTNISESLAKFILPLTVHHESRGRKKKTEELKEQESRVVSPDSSIRRLSRTQSFRKKTIPVNPLDLTEHNAYPYIQASSAMVNDCWPAVLATCSTFLNAALDADFYRALVRAVQKFTQVSGLLRLSTPRDAFLTTMGKAAVPSNHMMSSYSSPKSVTTEKSNVFSNAKALLSVDSLASQSSTATDKNRRISHDVSVPVLGARNLLCLRALLNLAIALGPTLQSAWSIIFETLQMADLVMSLSNHTGRASSAPAQQNDPEGIADKMDTETQAVQAAARRLFESTVDFPNESFTEVLRALCALLNQGNPTDAEQKVPKLGSRPHQRRIGSVSGISLNTDANWRDSAFALNKIGELAALNEARLSQYDPKESGWDVLIAQVVQFAADAHNATSTRLLAADILSRTVREIAEFSMSDEQREDIQARILSAVQTQISALRSNVSDQTDSTSDTDVRVHQIALEALKSIIEQCGESLVAGWGAVFESLMSVFVTRERPESAHSSHGERAAVDSGVEVISRSLARSAFATIHLVCSDFMSAVPDACLSTLLELLLRFSCQQEDLNMSLTAITFCWNVSDFLQSRNDLSVLPNLLDGTQASPHIQHKLESHSRNGVIPALWLQLLLNLSNVTTDARTEVRKSATQTIRRVFESYAEQISPTVWMLCLRLILFDLVQSNIEVHQRLRYAARDDKDIADWNATTKVILQTVSVLYTAHTEKLNQNQLGEAWSELLAHLQQYFTCDSNELAQSVFTTITEVLSHIEDMEALGMAPLESTAKLWQDYFAHRESWKSEQSSNQDAFLAYANAFEQIYRLANKALNTQLPAMLSSLEACVVDSDHVAYSSDIDHMTPLQVRVTECLSLIDTKDPDLPSALVRLLSRFVTLPYDTFAKDATKRGPTYVALAKASMDLLLNIAVKHMDEKTIFADGSFLFALQSLARPMHEKYSWEREGKPPTLWQKATSTAITMISRAIPILMSQSKVKSSFQETWTTIISVTHDITRAHIPAESGVPATLEKDEELDIKSFHELRDQITWSLGTAGVPDALRRTYTRNLFTMSIIHTPLPGELPDLANAPLDGLYKTRLPQSAELEMTCRPKMSYTCLSELFNLVAVHDGTSERMKLAQAASPYLILRAALPLKTYIADQPIRGRMPMPAAQRRELLFVLKELAKLESEPRSIPDAPGVKSTHRKHLHRLYPLLNKASRAARQDKEVFEHIVKLVDMVGDEFGLDE